MEIKELWKFPVPSTCLNNGVQFIHKNADALILFEYYDQENNNDVYNGGILFDVALAYRRTSEKFTKSLEGSYDTLVEYIDSDWIKELTNLNPEIAKFWNIRHFAIFLDGNGKYEVIAKNYKILEIKEGPLAE